MSNFFPHAIILKNLQPELLKENREKKLILTKYYVCIRMCFTYFEYLCKGSIISYGFN